MEDLNASFLAAFLDHIENARANGARSRNLRLTAIRSFFRYAALESPEHSGLIQRVLAIPNKRQSRPLVDFLSRPEIDALLAASSESPDLAGAPGLYASAHCHSDRLTAHRDHLNSTTGRQPRLRRAHPLRRKGTQGTMYSLNQIDCHRIGSVDPGTRCGSHTHPLSDRSRWPAQRRRGSVSGRETRCGGTTEVSIIGRKTCLAACPSSLCRVPDYSG
jgi:integrase